MEQPHPDSRNLPDSFEEVLPGKLPGWMFPSLLSWGQLRIEPFDDHCLANICYYLHFNNQFRWPKRGIEVIDLTSKESIEDAFEPYQTRDKIVLAPGASVIAQTYERVGISESLLSKIENTSALGRVFLNHASHGYIHPGHGIKEPFRLMIELTNLGGRCVEIVPAHMDGDKVVGPDAFRLYVEKLPYQATPYVPGSAVAKLKMNAQDRS
jgi:deoxycytidine triphosphate deaminase